MKNNQHKVVEKPYHATPIARAVIFLIKVTVGKSLNYALAYYVLESGLGVQRPNNEEPTNHLFQEVRW